MAEPMLQVRGLTKRFGGLTAVDQVDLEVYPGEVVGLLGDNGAGKSTLIKMVSGVYHPDGGQIFFQGREIRLGSPMDALELGIETLYQDLALAENLNVYANIFLGRERTKPFLGLHPGAGPCQHARGIRESPQAAGDRDPLAEEPASRTCPAGSARRWPSAARSTGTPSC